MNYRLRLEDRIDRSIPRQRGFGTFDRERTLQLRIQPKDESKDGSVYDVLLQSRFFLKTSWGWSGTLTCPLSDLEESIDRVRSSWTAMLDYVCQEDPGSGNCFANNVKFTNPIWLQSLGELTYSMADAGRMLFELLFTHFADEGAKKIGDVLRDATQNPRQLIQVESPTLFVPWPLLCSVGRRDALPKELNELLNIFWGSSHLIEHVFPANPKHDWRSRIDFERLINVGVNVDDLLDDEFHASPPIGPMIEFFHASAVVKADVRRNKAALQQVMITGEPREQVLYFCCHGSVYQNGQREVPQIKLTDQGPITANIVRDWFTEEIMGGQPLVFLNTCQGGQMTSAFYTSFGKALLDAGANSLVGPYIDIPPVFAVDYAKRFFRRVLSPGRLVGDVVLDLTQEYINHEMNPLGIVYSVFRGMDSHFWRKDLPVG